MTRIIGKTLQLKNNTYYNGCGRSVAYPLKVGNVLIQQDRFEKYYTASIPLNAATTFYGFDTNFEISFTGETIDGALEKLVKWVENPYEIRRNEMGEEI